MDVTVVVATRNRCSELLESLARHEAPVVLVDNGSTDDTVSAVRRELPDVTVVPLWDNRGAYARTIGARMATTDYIAFADDDSWWAPGSLQRAADLFRAHPRLGLLAARILVGKRGLLDPVCQAMRDSPLGQQPDLPGPSVLGFVACATMVRREAFCDIGGFDDIIRFPGEEDRVAMDLAVAGWSLVYVEDIVVHHHPSPRRDNPARRQISIVRSKLLTAIMRRPWLFVVRETVHHLLTGPLGRAGIRAALPSVGAALRARRPLGKTVENGLARLQPMKGFRPRFRD